MPSPIYQLVYELRFSDVMLNQVVGRKVFRVCAVYPSIASWATSREKSSRQCLLERSLVYIYIASAPFSLPPHSSRSVISLAEALP